MRTFYNRRYVPQTNVQRQLYDTPSDLINCDSLMYLYCVHFWDSEDLFSQNGSAGVDEIAGYIEWDNNSTLTYSLGLIVLDQVEKDLRTSIVLFCCTKKFGQTHPVKRYVVICQSCKRLGFTLLLQRIYFPIHSRREYTCIKMGFVNESFNLVIV